MTIAWHLRGYDRRSELLRTECPIGSDMIPVVRALLSDLTDDPCMIDPHELTRDQTVRLADALGVSLHPDRLAWFVEADEDWRLVQAKRDALSAAA